MGCASNLDVGCGAGAWLAEYREAGVEDVTGVDGDYVNRNRLLVGRDRFRALDVSQPFDLGRRFELVQSLEVAGPAARPAEAPADRRPPGRRVMTIRTI